MSNVVSAAGPQLLQPEADLLSLRTEHFLIDAWPSQGGRLARLAWRHGARTLDLIVPMQQGLDGMRWPKAGAYPLMPYSNRIEGGLLRFQGHAHPLLPHPEVRPHTLHGASHLSPWQARTLGAHRLEMSLSCEAGAHWPWRYRAVQAFEVDGASLHLDLSVTNEDDRPMPAGLGWHPFLQWSADMTLHHAARRQWPFDMAYLPLGESVPTPPAWQSPSDLRQPMSTAYLSDWDQALRWTSEALGVSVRLEADPVFEHLVVHRPLGGSYACIEPVTHVANAFNLAEAGTAGTGTRVLAPGESLRGRISLHCAVIAQPPPG